MKLLFIILTFFSIEISAQNIRRSNILEDSTFTNSKLSFNKNMATKLISHCDSLLETFGDHLILIAEMADSVKTDSAGHLIPSDILTRVPNPNSWSDYTTTSLLLAKNIDNIIISFSEVPISESGDWHNTYTHYFDENGNTIIFKRYSGFFNGCPGLSKETSIYYFDQNGILLKKEYELINGEGRQISSKDCDVFMYRHDYSIFKNAKEIINYYKINGLLN